MTPPAPRPSGAPDDDPMAATAAPEPPAPPLSALWRGAARDWTRFHLTDRAQGAAEGALFALLRHAPPEWAAAAGRALGALAGRIDGRRPYVGHMRRALALIRPDLDPPAREVLLARWWREAGTTLAQFPTLDRLGARDRLAVHGAERIAPAETSPHPTIYVMVHLGNWELIGQFWRHRLTRPTFGIWQPEPNRFRNRLVHRARLRLGTPVFPPSRHLPRRLLAMLRAGANPGLFVDEVSEGRCKFPLWGRPAPERCNLILTLRLAHATGARLQPAHFLRDGPGRASFHLLDPLEPRPDLDRDAYVETMARALSAAFEPRIAAHVDQWYMLKDMRVPKR